MMIFTKKKHIQNLKETANGKSRHRIERDSNKMANGEWLHGKGREEGRLGGDVLKARLKAETVMLLLLLGINPSLASFRCPVAAVHVPDMHPSPD